MESLGTEVRSFYSLIEIRETLEEEINQYKAIVEEYSQWLGLFLRDSEAAYSDKEWFKNLSSMQKLMKAKKPQRTEKKEGKKKREATSAEWIPYRDVMLCASEQGQAEIVFEAIEEINDRIDRLEKTKNSLIDLEKSGLGKDITYIAFIHNGVPEKLVLRHKKGEELAERFKFITELSVSADSK
jgi:uncharacterized protein (UPF0335 family)